MEIVKVPQEMKQALTQPRIPRKSVLTQRDRDIIAVAILSTCGYDNLSYFFDENGLKKSKIKPLGTRYRLMQFTSWRAIEVYLEKYPYEDK